MPGCNYKIRERVMVPNILGVQGIIISCLESIDRESVYTVRWFDVNAQPVEDHFPESDLVRADLVGMGFGGEAKTSLPENEFVPVTPRKRAARRSKKRSAKR